MICVGFDANKKWMPSSRMMQLQEFTIPMEWMVKTSVTFRDGVKFGYLVVFGVDAGQPGRLPHAKESFPEVPAILQRIRRTLPTWILALKDEGMGTMETRACKLYHEIQDDVNYCLSSFCREATVLIRPSDLQL
jgi:hypothetical protein